MNILIADDHAIVRNGLIGLLRTEYSQASYYEAANSGEVLSVTHQQSFDLILLDISMPGRSGIETLIQLRANGISCPILMLSMQPEEQYAIRVLKAGASGYLNKDCATDDLITAIRRVMSGKKYISEAVAEKLAEFNSPGGIKMPHERLSNRELEVLRMIASGNTITEMAESLSLSANTISTYRARILEKLGLNNNSELTRYALDNGLA